MKNDDQKFFFNMDNLILNKENPFRDIKKEEKEKEKEKEETLNSCNKETIKDSNKKKR